MISLMAFLLISQQKQATHSEMPLALQHLYATSDLYKDMKVIYLADRCYGSAGLICFFDYLGYYYCVRGKSYFYKSQINYYSLDLLRSRKIKVELINCINTIYERHTILFANMNNQDPLLEQVYLFVEHEPCYHHRYKYRHGEFRWYFHYC